MPFENGSRPTNSKKTYATEKRSTSKKQATTSSADALRHVRLTLLFVGLFEFLALAALLLMYFLDYPAGFKDMMEIKYWAIVIVSLFVIDTIVLWATFTHISALRYRADIDATSVIGSDVQEAYIFGEIGLIVTDENNVVIWTNSLFKERQMNLLDVNLLEYLPALRTLKMAPSGMTVKLEMNNRYYDVKYLSDANLYLFRDTTALEEQVSYSHDMAPVIGVVSIDNFAEIVGRTEDENNDLISDVRGTIMDYFKAAGVLLRRYRNDSYLAICNHAALEKMEKDGFSVLDKVRANGKDQSIVPTLSIGFAHGQEHSMELNAMASSAVGIAMSRGGDQAVVSHFGEDIRFYGGKTAAVENTSAIKYRTNADAVLNIIRDSSDVIVTGHKKADMDAIGGCIGILTLCEYLEKPCKIVFDSRDTEKKAFGAFISTFDRQRREELTITPNEAATRLARSPSTLLIVVDVSVPNKVMAGEDCLSNANKIVVIDHHRRSEQYIDKPVFEYIDPSASSVSEIFAEFIHYVKCNPLINIPAPYATLMLAGINLDTSFFKSNAVGARTYQAAEVLREFGADPRAAADFFKDDYEEYRLVNRIVSTMKTAYRGVVYAVCDDSDIVDQATLAKAANTIIQIREINAAFVIGYINDHVCGVSGRSDNTINVGLIMDKLGGGGHYSSAAASANDTSIQAMESRLLSVLSMYLNDAKSDRYKKETK